MTPSCVYARGHCNLGVVSARSRKLEPDLVRARAEAELEGRNLAVPDPGDVEMHAAVRAPPSLPDLAHDAPGDVIACEQLGRAAGVRWRPRTAES